MKTGVKRKVLTEDGFYLFSFALLDQRIEDDDVFALQKHERASQVMGENAITHGRPKKYALL
jgi:hypothetical protein